MSMRPGVGQNARCSRRRNGTDRAFRQVAAMDPGDPLCPNALHLLPFSAASRSWGTAAGSARWRKGLGLAGGAFQVHAGYVISILVNCD